MKVSSLLFGIWALFASANFVHSPKLHIPSLYSPPLGYMSSVGSYGPYPFTKFGSQNPDLPNRDTCFSDANGVSIKWPDLFHAGTDWFALSGESAASEPVTAIADGFVEWVSDSDANYPGSTIIIRHVDPELGALYSVYMHLIYPRACYALDEEVWSAFTREQGELTIRNQRRNLPIYSFRRPIGNLAKQWGDCSPV